jgi:hypothetical protein
MFHAGEKLSRKLKKGLIHFVKTKAPDPKEACCRKEAWAVKTTACVSNAETGREECKRCYTGKRTSLSISPLLYHLVQKSNRTTFNGIASIFFSCTFLCRSFSVPCTPHNREQTTATNEFGTEAHGILRRKPTNHVHGLTVISAATGAFPSFNSQFLGVELSLGCCNCFCVKRLPTAVFNSF